MRRSFVGGNWKMHGTLTSVTALVDSLLTGVKQFSNIDVVIFPSFVHLQIIQNKIQSGIVKLGAQNLNEHDHGAFTGEISGSMLQDFKCHYVLVGHSERRYLFHESELLVAQKFAASLKHHLMPVLCVGETLSEREAGKTEIVIETQLKQVIDLCGIDAFKKAVIAYEPVWAIGTGLSATPEQAQSVHAYIRNFIDALDHIIADELRIVYGGSVKANNAQSLFAMPDIDGGLVGGASLIAQDFIEICRATQ